MGYYEEFNPNAFEQGVYTWEQKGTYGIQIGVEINPMRSIMVMIGVGWEQHRRLTQTNLRIGICLHSCSIDLQGNRYDEEYPYFFGKGLATCAVNTAIQFLLPFFKQPESAYIGGEISNVDDQWAPEEKQLELAEKRRNCRRAL